MPRSTAAATTENVCVICGQSPCRLDNQFDARNARTACPKTGDDAVHIHPTIYQHDRAVVSGAADRVLWLRGSLLRSDQFIRPVSVVGVLPNARPPRPAKFQSNRADLRRGDAGRQLLLLLPHGPGTVVRLRAGGHAVLSS